MNDPLVFSTACYGGPLDGQQAVTPVGMQHFTHLTVLGSGCEVLYDDCLTDCGVAESHCYYLTRFAMIWSTGCCWKYLLWVHESHWPMNQANWTEVAKLIHASGCHVERTHVPSLQRPRTPMFRYGKIILSAN